MTLDEYMRSDGALTVAQLRLAVGAKSDEQIRQWRHGYANRVPSPENCALIEWATKGAVTCEDLRPGDPWLRIKDRTWKWNRAGRPVLDVSHRVSA